MKLKSLSQKDRYGNMFSFEFFEPDTSIPMMMVIPDMADGYNGADTDNHPGNPKGTDTVPAWLTPGENVVNAEASRIPGNQEKIDAMNEEGRVIQEAQGGPIPTYQDAGGIIQGVTDFFTMPTPPPGSGIKYRRHKDGSIGMWAGNTFRGYYKEPAKKESSFSERLGISYNAEGSTVPAYAAGGMQVPRPDGMLNSLGEQLDDRNGGPMYAAVGSRVPSWLTEEVLDSLKMVESSGNPNATSEKGAKGLYQIMPATAQQPGMGVTPLALKDIRDPVKSRRFAKEYLTQIAAYNPDFTPEEVITAYHSGAGNVRKAKNKIEALGPRGQAYAGKVLSNVNQFGASPRHVSVVPPVNTSRDARVAALNTAGQAQDLAMEAAILGQDAETEGEIITPPPIDRGPPTDASMVPAEDILADQALIRDLQKKGTYIATSDVGDPFPPEPAAIPPDAETIAAQKATAKGGMYNATSDVGDPFPPEPVRETETIVAQAATSRDGMYDSGANDMGGLGSDTPENAARAEQERKDRMQANEFASVPKLPDLPDDLNLYGDGDAGTDLVSLEEPDTRNWVKKWGDGGGLMGHLDRQMEEGAEIRSRGFDYLFGNNPEADEDINITGQETGEGFDYSEFEQDDKGNLTGYTKQEAAEKEAATNVTNRTKDKVQSIPPKGESQINAALKDPKKKPEINAVTNEVSGWFKDTFQSMFSGPELARMIVTYAASRALGYEHGGSLEFSMKNYIKRVDAQAAQRQKDVRDKDFMEAYTKKSLDKYLRTGNREDLIPKKVGTGINQASGNAYIPGIGKVQVYKNSKTGTEYVEYQGVPTPVSSLIGILEPWDESVQGRKAVINSFETYAKEAASLQNNEAGLFQGTKDKKTFDDRVYFNENALAKEAEIRYREILRNNALSINDAENIQLGVQQGINDYIKAKINFRTGKSDLEPNTVRAYINQRTREVLTGVPMDIIGTTSAVNMAKLDRAVKRSMIIKDPKQRIKKPDGNYLTYGEDYYNQWQATYQAWAVLNKLEPQAAATATADADKRSKKDKKDKEAQWSGFTYWASKTSPKEIERLIKLGVENNLIR